MIRAELGVAAIALVASGAVASAQAQTQTIWGNTLPEIKHVWKTVDNLTSGAFVKMWQQQVDRYYTRYSETATN